MRFRKTIEKDGVSFMHEIDTERVQGKVVMIRIETFSFSMTDYMSIEEWGKLRDCLSETLEIA